MDVDTKAFAQWSASALGIDLEDDAELQEALEKIGESNFKNTDQIRTLDLEAFLTVISKLVGKPPTCDEVLSLSSRLLLRTGREYFLAAQLVESLRKKNNKQNASL